MQISGLWLLWGLGGPSYTQFYFTHFGMVPRREQEYTVLTLRDPCSEGREIIQHLVCAGLDAGHLTCVILPILH